MNHDSSYRPAAGALMLLAPTSHTVPEAFRDVDVDATRHAHLLAQLQRLRGRVYLEDGAIQASQLSSDGRHLQDADEHSWHVVSVQADGSVIGCARYRPHDPDVTPEQLGIWQSALASDPAWRKVLHKAIGRDIALARRANVAYVELGGWAIDTLWRGTRHAFETAVSTYALSSGLGGGIGVTTATLRHCSARILRRLGGQSLAVDGVSLPSYQDPHYNCEMEILRFDSAAPCQQYRPHIERMASRFLRVPVIAARTDAGYVPAPTPAASSRKSDRHMPCFVPSHVWAGIAPA